jgi:hypothetical protein
MDEPTEMDQILNRKDIQNRTGSFAKVCPCLGRKLAEKAYCEAMLLLQNFIPVRVFRLYNLVVNIEKNYSHLQAEGRRGTSLCQ